MKTLATCLAIAICALAPLSQAQAQATGTGQHAKPAATPSTPSTPAERAVKADKAPSETIRGYTVERRAEAIAAARRATDEVDRQMERLQTQMSEGWSRMSTASRDRSQKAMADLRTRRNMLAEWMGGMKHGSSAAWTQVKGGFARSYDELAAALRKARSEFEQGGRDRTAPARPDEHPEGKKGR